MPPIDALMTVAATLVLAVVGSIIWSIRLEGRVNIHEMILKTMEKLHDERHEDTKVRLVRIEAKLDKLNGRVS